MDLEGPLSPAYAGRMPQTSILVGGQRLIMAIGGALRAAIRAGRFGTAARESRQRARALRSLNATGGVGNYPRRLPLEERGFERMSGFGYGETPRGNALVDNTFTGTRTVMPQGLDDYMFARPLPRSPIEAPYEGVRVWPGTRLPGFGESMQVGAVPGGTMRSTRPGVPFSVGEAPPWLGRGPVPAPTTGRFFPRDMSYGGGRMYDFEMGPLQGQQFFAPSIPVPALPRFYFDDIAF